MIHVSVSGSSSNSTYLCVPVLILLFMVIVTPALSEAQMISMEIPEQIFEGQGLNVSVTITDSDADVILYLEIENYSTPYILEKTFDNDSRVIRIPNLEAGTIPWELVVNNVMIESGEVEVIMPEDDSSQWPLVFVAVFFVLAFIGVEMSFKPGRRRKQGPEDDVEVVEEIMEEPPEEEYESSLISRDETGKLQ